MSLPSKRDFLVAAGLASPTRGRFSREAEAFAAENATLWADAPKVQATPKVKAAAAPKPVVMATPRPNPAGSYDPKAVRKWAEGEGLVEKGKRGRLPAVVIARYLSTDAGQVAQRAPRPTPAIMPKRRRETQAFGFYARKPGEPSHISEPLLVIENCGKCKHRVSYCPCPDGPSLPAYAGGGLAVLDPKPLV